MPHSDTKHVKKGPMTRFVAFTGERGCGKSTAAEFVADSFDYFEMKFAEPLKDMLAALYASCGLSEIEIEEKLEGRLKEVPCEWLCGRTPRYAMQTLGTEWRDLIAIDLWTSLFALRVAATHRNIESGLCRGLVCSDYRFPHEGAMLRQLGFTCFRIERDRAFYSDSAAAAHPSEKHYAALPVDGVIHNNGTLDEFHAAIRAALKGDTA